MIRQHHALTRIAVATISILACTAYARELGEPDLASDEYTKRFTASYGVLSEREPPLTDIEIAILKKMAPMMRVNKEYAQTLLQSLTVTEASSSATFNYLLGNIYYENDEYFLAEEQYKKAIEAYPDFLRAWKNLGVLKLRSNDTRSALHAFVKAIELGDDWADTYGLLGFCHYKEGNYISAEAAYDRAMLAQPDNLEWLEGKAQVYFEADRYIEAIRMQDELISRQPNNVAYWMAQTNAYLGYGDLARTARNLEIIRGMNKADFQSLYLLGSVYAKLNMTAPSAEAYLAASKLSSKDNYAFMAKAAKQLFLNKEYASAETLLNQLSASADDLDRETKLDLAELEGDIATKNKDTQAAVAAFERAEKLDPTRGRILVKLARAYADSGNRDRAYLVLDRAEQDPNSEYNAALTRAKFLIDENRFEEAQAYVIRALKIDSNENIQNLLNQVQQAASDQ